RRQLDRVGRCGGQRGRDRSSRASMNITFSSGSRGSSPAMASGCLILFGLPFAAGGLFALEEGIRRAIAGQWMQALIPGGMGLLFPAIGVGVMVGGRKAGAAAKARQARVDSAPDSPWLWREDWASGQIEDRSASAGGAFWLFAIFWNLVSFPALL